MHRKSGHIAPAKVLVTNRGLTAILDRHSAAMRALLAAVLFLLWMQIFHISFGPSELYFAGAIPVYLMLGFVPALIGIALALLLQGVVFEPLNLPQLAMNSLPLLLPLIAVHFTLGRKLNTTTNGHHLCWRSILKLGAMYYAGMTGMVGVWLLIAPGNTPFAAWGAFATSCLAITALESAVTYSVLRMRSYKNIPVVHISQVHCTGRG